MLGALIPVFIKLFIVILVWQLIRDVIKMIQEAFGGRRRWRDLPRDDLEVTEKNLLKSVSASQRGRYLVFGVDGDGRRVRLFSARPVWPLEGWVTMVFRPGWLRRRRFLHVENKFYDVFHDQRVIVLDGRDFLTVAGRHSFLAPRGMSVEEIDSLLDARLDYIRALLDLQGHMDAIVDMHWNLRKARRPRERVPEAFVRETPRVVPVTEEEAERERVEVVD